MYDVTLRAQQQSLAAVKSGVTGSDVDSIARALLFADAGYGDYFGHGSGHGVGFCSRYEGL